MLLNKICIIATKAITVAKAAIRLVETIARAAGIIKRKTKEAAQDVVTETTAKAGTDMEEDPEPETIKEALVAVLVALIALFGALGSADVITLLISGFVPERRRGYVFN